MSRLSIAATAGTLLLLLLLPACLLPCHASDSSGVVLSDVHLKVSRIDPNAPPCVGAHCRTLVWKFRAQKLIDTEAGAMEGRMRPPVTVTPSDERTDDEARHTVTIVGMRASIYPTHAGEEITGSITGYDDDTGRHMFVRDDTSVQQLLPLKPRTTRQQVALVAQDPANAPPTRTDCAAFSLHSLQAPSTDSVSGVALSQAFFTWLALPPSSFVVNLNPSQPDLVIDRRLAATRVGQILLEADLRLKNETAWALHPETADGWRYWTELDIPFPTPELCLNFRTWIVPAADVEVVEVADALYVTSSATLSVQEESDVATTNFAHESTKAVTGCSAADPLVQQRAEALFRRQALPRIIERINTAPEFDDLRTVFYWRVLAEWYTRQPPEYLAKFGLTRENLQATPRLYAPLTEPQGMAAAQDVFRRYVETVRTGAYSVRRVHQVEDGRRFARTYAQGRIDLANVDLRITQVQTESETKTEEEPRADDQL